MSIGSSSWFSCYVNLTATVLGAGILGLPFAFTATGFVIGPILIVICGGFSIMGLHLLSLTASKVKSGVVTFYSVAELASPTFCSLIDIAIIVKCFGVATAYLIVIGDLMPQALAQFDVPLIWTRRETWVLMGFAIAAPLSCFDLLDKLKFTSFASIVLVFILVVVVLLYALVPTFFSPCPDSEPSCTGASDFKPQGISEVFQVLSIFVFGFTCHQNTFAVYNELQFRSQHRLDTVFIAAIATAAIMYIIVAVCGYNVYGSSVKSNFLKSLPDNKLVVALRVFVSVIVAFHYPLQANPGVQISIQYYILQDIIVCHLVPSQVTNQVTNYI